MCSNSTVSKCRDGRQDNGTLAVTEHVGVEASTRQSWVALAYCHTTRRVTERAGSKVKSSAALTPFPYTVHCTASWITTRIKTVLNKHDVKDTIWTRSRRWSCSVVSAQLDLSAWRPVSVASRWPERQIGPFSSLSWSSVVSLHHHSDEESAACWCPDQLFVIFCVNIKYFFNACKNKSCKIKHITINNWRPNVKFSQDMLRS